jgi:thiosulfate dehydrogenase
MIKKNVTILKSISYIICFIVLLSSCNNNLKNNTAIDTTEHVWRGWNHYQIKETDTLERYGYQLISNTAYYFGPKGKVLQITNGMNCQNCHLDGGTIPWGNNFSAVASTYPKYKERSGVIESMEKRVNDCMERSLNGKAIDSNSKEMKAFVAYIKWVGSDVPKGKTPKGSGIMNIDFLNRAADAE